MDRVQAASETRVNFQNLPAELIENVFVHSLPDNALDQKQPNVRIAPMLLCHVCSQWRTIARELPRLWRCLFHVVRILTHQKASKPLKEGIQHANLEFLEWWWCNLSANHPFHLRFHINFEGIFYYPEDVLFVKEHLPVALFNLAQHLDVTQKVAEMIHWSPITLPNLQTLRIRSSSEGILHPLDFFPVRPDHPIRKLHMQVFELKEPDVFERPILSWSSLTHVLFTYAYLPTLTWFDLIRASVNLQFGYFQVHIDRSSEEPQFANPPHFTHRHLRQLVVAWDDGDDGGFMLKNLLLPSLTALRTFASLTADQYHFILESTPSLVELHLGCASPMDAIWYSPYADDFPEPLSKYAPNLQHLVIQTPLSVYWGEEMRGEMRENIDNLVTSSWLQLGEPTNTVRTLEIRMVSEAAQDFRKELDDRLAINPIRWLKVSVVDNDEPLLWKSSTALEQSEAEYFEGADFGGPGYSL
jgi:hypothetical protein